MPLSHLHECFLFDCLARNVASSDQTIRVWNITVGRESVIFKNITETVRYLVVLPDGDLAGASSDIKYASFSMRNISKFVV